MARLLEDDAKRLLANAGVAVPKSTVVTEPEEAEIFARELDQPTILKALLPFGGRQKLGLVKTAETAEECSRTVKDLLGASVNGFTVGKVLVEELIKISRELYAAVLNDTASRSPIVLVSSQGGVDVQEIHAKSPESSAYQVIDPTGRLEPFRARELWIRAGVRGPLLVEVTSLLHRLFTIYSNFDATLLEVNPIAITPEERVVVASCVLEVDDDALFRHPELEGKVVRGLDRLWRPLTEREQLVVQADLDEPSKGDVRYAEFEGGDIGFICGGGGGSLMLQDAVRAFGGKPANYSEWGGNPSARKMETLTRVVLSKPGVKGLLVCLNISNNTRIDTAAGAITKVLKESRLDTSRFPVVIRLAGLSDESAKEVVESAGFEYHGEDLTMDESARLIVERMRNIG